MVDEASPVVTAFAATDVKVGKDFPSHGKSVCITGGPMLDDRVVCSRHSVKVSYSDSCTVDTGAYEDDTVITVEVHTGEEVVEVA